MTTDTAPTKLANLSIEDLNAESAGETPFEFEMTGPKGENTGVFLSVLGGESETVKAAVNKLLNERRRAEAIVAAQSRPGKVAPITTAEDDTLFGKRLAAVRLVGWRGIKEPYTPELALKLVQRNADIAAQILTESDKLSNFMKGSSPT